MFTENEAKQRWCPFARTVETEGGTEHSRPRNRVAKLDAVGADASLSNNLIGCQCIASECMVWRWVPVDVRVAEAWDIVPNDFLLGIKMYRAATGSSLADSKHWADAVKRGDELRPADSERGFCGLAGKP